MKYRYPAIFYKEEDGKVSVVFPEFNNLATFGDNMQDALIMAEEALVQHITTALKDGETLPEATLLDTEESNAVVKFVSVCIG